MGNARKQYSKEYKLEAVKLITERGFSVAQTARNLGVSENMLHRWRKELGDRGEEKAFPGNGVPVEQELALLRAELEKLRRERDILKKATIFFAQHHPEK